MYNELRNLGFPRRLIADQTGLSIYRLDNMTYTDRATYSFAEVEAFNAYYDKAKALSKVYGDKLSEYLSENESKQPATSRKD